MQRNKGFNLSNTFVELNAKEHDRKSFDCGNEELNDFLATKAARHMKARVSRTMVLADSTKLPNGLQPIRAFYSVTSASMESDVFKDKKLPHYPIPVFLIAQLAVNKTAQGNKVGSNTLYSALKYLYSAAQNMPAYAVTVDAYDSSVVNFYEKFGFVKLTTVNSRDRMYLPMNTVAQLFE